MKKYAALIIFALTIAISPDALLAQDRTLEGNISEITKTFLVINGNKFPIEPSKAECFESVTKNKLTCETLAGVGYVDSAKVTVSGGTVTKIELLKLSQ